MKKATVELDGRTLEGGGQLLRIALSLSALTGIPISIQDIRGNRTSGGGLKLQHLTCVKWLAHACNAETEGAMLKSKSLLFKPGILHDRVSPAYTKRNLPGGRVMFECHAEIGSAGSTALALQAILPYIIFAPPRVPAEHAFVRLHMDGGTNVSGSPSFEYITQVLLPTLEGIGLPPIAASLQRRGWSIGPAGTGYFFLDIPLRPEQDLPPFSLAPANTIDKPQQPTSLNITFLGPTACHRHLRAVLLPALHHHFKPAPETIDIACEDSRHPKRLYLIIVATTTDSSHKTHRLASDWLYDRKVAVPEKAVSEMAERVAQDVYDEWKSGAWVDEHMRDQLVVFKALASGECHTWEGFDDEGLPRAPSLHAQTAEWVVNKMLKRSKKKSTEQLPSLEDLTLDDSVGN